VFNEQKLRAFLFYLSLAVFFLGLPPILSFALGYKFNPHTLKFTKTGIISLKTQPDGASVYLNNKLLTEKTPSTINELLPGLYNLRIELKDYYPRITQVNVEPRKVSRFEKIILFPKRPDIKQLNQERVNSFWLDKDNGRMYYFNEEENILYQSNLDGDKFEEIGSLPDNFNYPPLELKISPDKTKILVFSIHQILILNLKTQGQLSYYQPPVILDYPAQKINNVFWHSDSYHLVLIADKNIDVLEAEAGSQAINLVRLNKKASVFFYDTEKDELYFMDLQKSSGGSFYDNVYKLELRGKAFLRNNLRAERNERK